MEHVWIDNSITDSFSRQKQSKVTPLRTCFVRDTSNLRHKRWKGNYNPKSERMSCVMPRLHPQHNSSSEQESILKRLQNFFFRLIKLTKSIVSHYPHQVVIHQSIPKNHAYENNVQKKKHLNTITIVQKEICIDKTKWTHGSTTQVTYDGNYN